MNLTRSGKLVDKYQGSCLGEYSYGGMNDWGFGCRNVLKRGGFDKYAGICPSKNIGVQRNHRCGYWPRKYLYDNRFTRIGFIVLVELKEELMEMRNCNN